MLIPLVLAAGAIYLIATHKKPAPQAQTVTGVSGTPYAIAENARSTPAVQIVDVYLLPNGTPIMEFAVTRATGVKQFLSSSMAATDPILKRARQDLAV